MTSARSRSLTRGDTIRALFLVLTGAIGVFIAAAIAMNFFDALGALGTSATRMSLAAVILLIVFRPRLRGRSRQEWAGIVLYGVAMASMNSFLYLAFDRLPLGVAVTIDFLGPCAVALAASRRPREGALAIAAILGVGLIAGFGGPFDPIGLVFAALAGASFGLYTLFAARVGQSEGGLPGVALSVTVAAVLTLPFSIPVLPRMQPEFWLPLIASAGIGTALAFSVDTLAGRLTSARVLGVFFALDPVVSTVIGVLVLGQALTPAAFAGIMIVVAAGAGIVWFAGEKPEKPEKPEEPAKPENPETPGDLATPETPKTPATAEKTENVENTATPATPAAPDPARGSYAGGMSERAVESIEIERKYEVSAASELPGAEAFAAVGLVPDAAETVELAAAYFDTGARDLARNRLAVRVRFGGKDAGWHLKMKGAEGARELLWPPAEEMPAGLREEIAQRIGADAVVAPIAELRTERRVVRLRDADGREAVELVDDRVRALDRVSGVRRVWREWEAELAPGAEVSLLDAVEPVLRAAGADPSPSPAKIARASGALELMARAAGAGEERLEALRAMDAADRAAGLLDDADFAPVVPRRSGAETS